MFKKIISFFKRLFGSVQESKPVELPLSSETFDEKNESLDDKIAKIESQIDALNKQISMLSVEKKLTNIFDTLQKTDTRKELAVLDADIKLHLAAIKAQLALKKKDYLKYPVHRTQFISKNGKKYDWFS